MELNNREASYNLLKNLLHCRSFGSVIFDDLHS